MFFVRGYKSLLHKLLVQLLEKELFSFELEDLPPQSNMDEDLRFVSYRLFLQSLSRAFEGYLAIVQSLCKVSVFFAER